VQRSGKSESRAPSLIGIEMRESPWPSLKMRTPPVAGVLSNSALVRALARLLGGLLRLLPRRLPGLLTLLAGLAVLPALLRLAFVSLIQRPSPNFG
jgi:hypothetical protein